MNNLEWSETTFRKSSKNKSWVLLKLDFNGNENQIYSKPASGDLHEEEHTKGLCLNFASNTKRI